MDNSQDRPSGIPRPSRLPVPRPVSSLPRSTSTANTASSLRPRPSRDSLGGSAASLGELQNPKLRTSASRGQLRSSTSTSVGRTPSLRASASSHQLRSSSTRAPAAKPTAPPPKAPRAVSGSQRRWSNVANAPSSQYKPWAEETGNTIQEPSDDRLASYLNDSAAASEAFVSNELLVGSSERASAPELSTSRSKKPRPSLSERTMETLAHIPSSPAMSKKSSSFFDSGRPTSRAGSSHSRPGSSYNSEGSGRLSRPGSSGNPDETSISNFRGSTYNLNKRRPSTAQTAADKAPPSAAPGTTPRLRPSASRASLAASNPSASLPVIRSPSPEKRPVGRTPVKPAQKAASKTLKQRASTTGLSKKPSLPAISGAGGDPEPASPTTAWDGSITPAPPAIKPAAIVASDQSARKSSAALRDHIAKAKAAKRAAMRQSSGGEVPSTNNHPIPSNNGPDFESAFSDPFNLGKSEDSQGHILKQRVAAGRASGKLNIAALSLKDIPDEVLKMYDYESIGDGGSWLESVELTRLIAADNELETLTDDIFPDRSLEELQVDENCKGNIFGGLETIDMHGNRLASVPMGFRRLSHLTSLNLSSNRLENSCIAVIAQMTSIRDLKLANNCLEGPLDAGFSNLTSLEILDLHGNKVSALSPNIESIARLRILNLSENNFESLDFEALAKLPLIELDLKKNRFSGTLIENPNAALPLLQKLDISTNRLTRLVPADASISLPVIHTLSLSMNRLQELPDMTTWTNLSTLTADQNNIANIPMSFTTLEKLRQADLSGNDLRVIPPEIARMDNLTLLHLSGNPLRDKKFASASTDEIKEVLIARLEPPPPYQEPIDQTTIAGLLNRLDIDKKLSNNAEMGFKDGDSPSDQDEDFATPPTSAPHTPARSRAQTLAAEAWVVKPGGLLDRSRTESSSLHPAACAEVARKHQIKQAQLHHNQFSTFPISLNFFAQTLTSLALGHNQLSGESYLAEELSLPVLTELNLASNHITSLEPLTRFLHAPSLEKIDISLNRLNNLPLGLKQVFPNMKVLLAANNHITELDPASIKGLKIADVSSNDIGHLDPRLGLLGGKGGLERLDVSGNRFRVPRWNVLERGTEATMRWLRGRVAAADMAAWKEENGEDGFDDVD